MKKIVIALIALLIISVALLAQSFSAAPITVGSAPVVKLPKNNSPENTKIIPMVAGKLFSKAGLAYRGGSFDEDRDMVMGVALITHPKGNLLIDAGFASNVDEHFATTPWLMQKLSKYDSGIPVKHHLASQNFDTSSLTAIILTHAHWDHVSGIEDLADVPVWVSQAEKNFIDSNSEHTALARSLGAGRYQSFQFSDGPFLGFDASYDIFGDQSVVIAPASGHTPGAVIVFVTLANEQRYAFIGDLAWQSEGIDIPTEKPWLPRVMIGEDRDAVKRLLAHMHHLQKQIPNLTVLPSHDARAWEELNAQLAH